MPHCRSVAAAGRIGRVDLAARRDHVRDGPAVEGRAVGGVGGEVVDVGDLAAVRCIFVEPMVNMFLASSGVPWVLVPPLPFMNDST